MNTIAFMFFLSIAVIAWMAAVTQFPPMGERLVAAMATGRSAATALVRFALKANASFLAKRSIWQIAARAGESPDPERDGERLDMRGHLTDPQGEAGSGPKIRDILVVYENRAGIQRQVELREIVARLTPGRPAEPDAPAEAPADERFQPAAPERTVPVHQPDRSGQSQPREDRGPATVGESESGRDVFARLEDVSRFNAEDVMVPNDEIPIDDRIPSSVTVFLHVTGGAGATTFAVNAACSLAGPRRNCCLLDLDVQFGGVGSLLDLPPAPALQALMEDPRRLERVALESMLVRHATGVHVLTAPRVPIPLHGLKAAAVTELIRIAKSRFTYVVVDMPVALTTWTDAVLRLARCTYLVTPLSVQAAHRTARFLHLLKQQDLAQLPLKVIANRYNSTGGGALIGPKQFAKAIGRSVDHLIPNDYETVLTSHNQGVPAVRLAPKSKFSQAIVKMLSEEMNEAPPGQSQSKLVSFDRS